MINRNSKLSNVPIGMGGALIITIFVVLCLTIFSVLSFTTAYSDLKLAKKTEEMTYDYYSIHGKAEEKLASIYDVLVSTNENMSFDSSSNDFYDNAIIALREIKSVSIIDSNKNLLKIYYEELGDKNQKISVTLNIMYDIINRRPYYDIETWNLSTIELPVYEEENFDLWEGFE